jgi:hypothetical protein
MAALFGVAANFPWLRDGLLPWRCAMARLENVALNFSYGAIYIGGANAAC